VAITVDVLLGRGFRPFFLLAAAQAVVAVGTWLAVLRAWIPAPAWATSSQWHAHEMVFGFAVAAVAGFLLTSVPVWTRRPAVVGARLAGLVALWLAARVAVFLAAPRLAALVELVFFLALAGVVTAPIARSRSVRNAAFPVLVLALGAADAASHAGVLAGDPEVGPAGLRLGVGILVVLISILGGRLVPLFTGNALRRAGRDGAVRRVAWADAVSGPLVIAFFLALVAFPDAAGTGVLGLAAGAVLALRAGGWRMRESLADPLLWSMHLAWWWLPVGLAAWGLAELGAPVSSQAALHALTVGGVGGMILAIMSRVSLGHTGRPFVAPAGMATAFALVHAAAFMRAALPMLVPGWTATWWQLSGGLWLAAFGLFGVIYGPILLAPRVDGKPG
jgi:uncharacterized protein involved in response to NO